jgi:tetratricopeptide (TPR) repeat protein
MKAEHRKELKTNALADSLGRALQTMKEGPSQRTLLWAVVIVVVVVLFLVWRWVKSSSEESDSRLWMRLENLYTPGEVQTFADEAKGTTQARVARFQLARLRVRNGVQTLGGASKDEGRQALQEGAQAYEALIEETRDLPVMQQEALMGAAKAYESLGNLDKAQAHYQKLKQEYPDTPLGKDAAQQLERLKDEAANKDLEALRAAYGNSK